MKENIQKQFGNIEIPHNYKYVILPIPFEQTTTYQKGCEKGPEALLNASCQLELYDIETDSEPYLAGIFTAPPILAATSKEMIDKAYESITSYLHQDKFVISLGGEHSISLPAILAYLDHYHTLTVLQFDAHADLYPHYDDNPYSHASVMARVKEKGVSIVRVGL
ncbi:MAG: arginase family protein, partial [Parachlamydiaceae bacterium]